MLGEKLTKSLLRTTDNYISALEKAGILTVNDLLNHFPRDYEDRTNVLDSFSLINIKEKNTIIVKLLTITSTKTANNKLLTKAILEDKNGFLSEAVWFNRKYLATSLKGYEQKKVIVSGSVKYAFGKVTFQNPEVETDLDKLAGEIVPIYPELNYIPSKWIEGKIDILKSFIKEIVEDLPEEIVKKYNFISKRDAVLRVHFPKNKIDIEQAKYRLAYGELFDINYRAIGSKIQAFKESEGRSLALKMNPELVKELLSFFPFEFTNHQKIVLFQILKDMEKPHSMQRLLEGDVGTGKTAVAFVAALHAIIESNKIGNRIQVAIMAPTEILARQHFEGMQDFLLKFGISSHLLVGSLTPKQKTAVKADIKSGNIDLVVGTHALVQEDVVFNNLGFVVVDEQHRFGVRQREVLEKGFGNKSGLVPHSLNMTATPIPRTLALTLYGDQDLSIINEYPKGRKDIFTKVAKNEEERQQINLFVRSELEKGRQVFWISPLVEESEKIDLANAINTYENLQAIFHPFKVGLLHGKMRPKEKDEIMKAFANNEIQILSSTSVVEVGVNVPNSTIMCIEGAERFGLSQLHQFRGRVGRGNVQSYCYLFPTTGNSTDRLKAMEKTNNGFELAEIDLELRGPGEVYGVRQSGVPDLKVASLTDLELISQIREDIEELFEKKDK
ncbi:ATP-dependent DNA helicase RecG [Candidatus Gracilibacteria bacterium]|nr:ATP-dependent DNA helicase RecG [Candidatus Gracilibacteria bacterium]